MRDFHSIILGNPCLKIKTAEVIFIQVSDLARAGWIIVQGECNQACLNCWAAADDVNKIIVQGECNQAYLNCWAAADDVNKIIVQGECNQAYLNCWAAADDAPWKGNST